MSFRERVAGGKHGWALSGAIDPHPRGATGLRRPGPYSSLSPSLAPAVTISPRVYIAARCMLCEVIVKRPKTRMFSLCARAPRIAMWAFFVVDGVVVSPRYLVRGLRRRPARKSVDQEGSVVGSFEGGEPTHNT